MFTFCTCQSVLLYCSSYFTTKLTKQPLKFLSVKSMRSQILVLNILEPRGSLAAYILPVFPLFHQNIIISFTSLLFWNFPMLSHPTLLPQNILQCLTSMKNEVIKAHIPYLAQELSFSPLILTQTVHYSEKAGIIQWEIHLQAPTSATSRPDRRCP